MKIISQMTLLMMYGRNIWGTSCDCPDYNERKKQQSSTALV